MCGIAGWLAARDPADMSAAEDGLRQAIEYRGRDARGAWSEPGRVGLYHSRLSIIDVSGGAQPMMDVERRYVIVFNGEIYNYQELRQAYEAQGARFATRSDTEVILEGFKLKGRSVCEDLNGMFAFAIWDCQEKTLFLARDRLGKKPLYWTQANGVFCFSSSLDSFHALAGWNGSLCQASIALYGVLGVFPEDLTVYRHAHALPPACWAQIRPGSGEPEIGRYWRFDFSTKRSGDLDSLLQEYESILADAIRIRLRSDVPLALTFSGGVDSGSIAAVALRKLDVALPCFTIDYHTDAESSEETLNAEIVARHLGLPWQYIHFDYRQRLLDELAETYRYYDQPCQQLALVYSQRLYEAIKPHATVVLSGNGADELFTGYIGDERIYRRGLVLAALRPLRPLLVRAPVSRYLRQALPEAHLGAVVEQVVARLSDTLDARVAGVLDGLVGEALASGAESALDFKMFMAIKCAGVDSNYRLPDISGLAAQIEVRSPYLDYRMVEFAAKVPDRFKVSRCFSAQGNKYLPKRYYERQVPRDLAWSRKKGMAWNMHWGVSAATDPDFMAAIAACYDRLDQAGISTAGFRLAWSRHIEHIRRHGPPSPYGTATMSGFMLGQWLSLRSTAARLPEQTG